MRIIPVPLRTMVLFLIAFSWQSFGLTQQQAREAGTCRPGGNSGAWRPYYVSSFDNAWVNSGGNNLGSTQTDGPRDCNQRKTDVQKCCAPNSFVAADCENHLRAMYPSANWAAQNPFTYQADEAMPSTCTGGVHTSAECQKANLFRSSRNDDRMAGFCRALSQTCLDKCSLPTTAGGAANPADRVCQDGVQFSNQACGTSNQNLALRDNIDPNRTGGGGPSSPGGTPGNQQSGNQPPPTQRGSGSGNPMQMAAAMAPALAALAAQQQPQQQPQQNSQVASFQSESCATNANQAHCPAQAAAHESWNKKVDPIALENTKDNESSGGDFNTATTEGANPAYGGNGEAKFGTPASNAAIPQGGGQMPGQNSGGAAAAGGGQTTGGFGIASKAATDIMHGMMSGGGYSAMNAGMQMQNGATGGGFGGYGQTAESFKPGMDLRAFLPGGKADPTRKMAGGAASFQIQPQTVNIWSRISERIRARCTQGLLRDCDGSAGTRMPASMNAEQPKKN